MLHQILNETLMTYVDNALVEVGGKMANRLAVDFTRITIAAAISVNCFLTSSSSRPSTLEA